MLMQSALVVYVWFCRGGKKSVRVKLSVPMSIDGRWCYMKVVLCIIWFSHLDLLVMKNERLV